MGDRPPASSWRTKLVSPRYIFVCLLLVAGIGFWYTITALRDPAYELRVAKVTHTAIEAAQSAKHSILGDSASGQGRDAKTSTYCDNFPDTGNISVIVKTGATEALDKLPTQLVTSLRCVKDPILVSDLDQTVGKHHIHNVLATVSPDAMNGNPEFDFYRKLHQLATSGQETAFHTLNSMPIAQEDWRTKGKSAAWGLDKYKFLHMAEKAWELQPDRDWYVFIEADTYLSWRSLHAFLALYDSSKPWYLGSKVKMWEHKPAPIWFAYGGSGFLLSGSVVREWNVEHSGLANSWDERVKDMWFGDFVIADALNDDLKVQLTDAFPMMHNDEPALVPFNDGLWCKPVVTLHHLDSRQLDQIYHAELALNNSPLLFKDVYHSAYTKGLPFKLESWDNLADDDRFALDVIPNDMENFHGQWEPKDLADPHRSYMGCEVACMQNEDCFQFSFLTTMANWTDPGTECHLSSVFRLGRQRELETWGEGTVYTRTWVSGWKSDRISRWVENHPKCP